MKKTFISSLILGSLLLPSLTFAQVFSPEQQNSLDALKQELIDLLVQEVAQLQAQLTQLLAQEAQTTQAIANLTPPKNFGTPTPTYTPVTSITLGQMSCFGSKSVKVPFAVDGSDWDNIVISYLTYPEGAQVQGITPIYNHQDQLITSVIKNPNAPFLLLLNVPTTYNFTEKVYDRNKNLVQTFAQSYIVEGSCRTPESESLYPLE